MRPVRIGFFSPSVLLRARMEAPCAPGGGNALRHRYARYPRLQRMVIVCCALTALTADLAHGAGNAALARAAFCATFILLPVALLLMRCCLLMDERGVFIGTPLHRYRLLWRDMDAVGYMQCNARRVYLYGMEKGDDSFARMLHDAPFATPRHFVVPASAALRAAVVSLCPFPPESVFARAEALPRTHRRLLSRLYMPALLLLPGGALALLTGARIALSACQNAYATLPLCALCAAAIGCAAAGLYLLSSAANALSANPVLGPQGVRVGFAGRSLTLRWEDMGALCRLRAPGVGTLYLLSAPLPPAGDSPAQPPLRCISLCDTRSVLFAVHSFCLLPVTQVRVPARLTRACRRG